MTERDKRPDPDEAMVRKTFARAGASHEPQIDRLIAAVPSMMTEARRRRRLAETPAARISIAASRWLPRMAAAAVLLVAIALLWPARRAAQTATLSSDASAALDSWVVTGSSPQSVSDPVMDALVQ